jgi:acyl transferase domain-containing protein
VLQIALVELLRSWDVMPAIVVGHSSGEIAAAYATGALSHESACIVAYHRGQVAELARNASISDPGAMLSVNLTEGELSAYLGLLPPTARETISVACINSATNLTLSGPSSHLDTLKELLQQQEIFAQKVNSGVAYHSPAMYPFSADYAQSMGRLQADSNVSKGAVMISAVTACPVAADVLTQPQYWVRNLLSPVKFAEALKCMADSSILRQLPFGTRSISDVIEIGPHSTLRRPCRDTVPDLNYHSALRRGQTSQSSILKVIGALFAHGHTVSILKSNGHSHDNSTSLLTDCPSYPFDHSKRYWSESRLSKDHRLRACTAGYLLGTPAHDWNPLQPRWRNWLSIESFPWLADHVVSFQSGVSRPRDCLVGNLVWVMTDLCTSLGE